MLPSISLVLWASVAIALTLPHSYTHTDSHNYLHRPTSLQHKHDRRGDAVSDLLYIAPTSASCSGAEFPAECVASSEAIAEAIVISFAKYNVTTAPEQAALLSWMAYESGAWKYNTDHYPAPGRPGQGTRNMMMPNYVLEYASSIDTLSTQVDAAGGDVGRILALVQPDEYSFASAAWYYSTQCGEGVKESVRHEGLTGWQAFVSECVVTTVNGEREAYWTRACEALGVST
ncbi:hypothetical protein EDD37DRAFT_677238 [Exophiala viscosa]|uniref:uncharacterized protein n=1 Tax=Exophiala viscosa TaxID=2486360 RepID=UPI002196FDA3|nr:hypothetical protein EDD37DRAFT_677238 [Exophiala viscosa]